MKPTPAALRSLAKRDPVLGRAMKHLDPYPGFPEGAPASHKQGSHFESLARAIVYQQLAGKAAATIFGRVCALTPGKRFPKAPDILRLSESELRGAGLSNNKFLALRDLAGRVESKELRLASIARQDDERIVEDLVAVRGIGVWTAQMFLMFRLGRLDVMPGLDLGVQEGIRRLDDLAERPKPKEVEARAEVWAPLRSVAAWYMWRLADGGGA